MTESNPVSQRQSRLRANIGSLVQSRTFHIFLILLAIYAGAITYFILVIQPEPDKVPFESPVTWVRDLIWILGWRYNLDYLIIIGFLLVVILETGLYSVALRKSRNAGKLADRLSIYVSPAINFGFSYLYMLAIDLGVTYFADLGFNGTWASTVILFLGMTPQMLYHDFFFWFIPLVIICGIVNQVFFRTRSCAKTLQTFCVCMGVYSLNLGLLDPVVCQILWGDWRIFGTWAMGGADAIWAEGWIAHYVLFAVFWFAGTRVIARIKVEIALKP